MRRKLKSYLPGFFKQIDQKLLLNYPNIWATNLHYVLFLGAIGFGLMCFYAMVKPIDLTDVPNPHVSYSLAIIPAIIFFLIWAYFTSRLQTEKRFGEIQRKQKVLNMLIYALVIGLIASAPMMYFQMIKFKLRTVISEETLVEDTNVLNLGEFMLTISHEYFENLDNGTPEPLDHFNGYYRYCQYCEFNYEIWETAETEDQLKKYNSDQKRLEFLTHYLEIFKRYSRHSIHISPHALLAKLKGEYIPTAEFYELEEEKYYVGENFNYLQMAYSENVGAFTDYKYDSGYLAIAVYLSVLTVFWISLQVFFKTNLKITVMTIVLLVISVIMTDFLDGIFRFVYPDKVGGSILLEPLLLVYSILFIFYFLQGFRNTNKPRIKVWNLVAFSVAAISTPIMPLIFSIVLDDEPNDNQVQIFLYVGIFITILCWLLIYEPRFTKLSAQPKNE